MELIPWWISLNGRFLHNGGMDSNSVCRRLLGSSLATQQYKVCPYAINTDGVIGLAISRTRWQITPQPLGVFQFCFPGGCWARRQLHAGIRLIPTPLIFMKLPYPGELLGGGAPREAMCVTPASIFRYSTRIRKFNRILFK